MEYPIPTYVSKAGVDVYRVAQPGWYVFDKNRAAILGPYHSREECAQNAMEDQNRRRLERNNHDRTIPPTIR
jgi:hypothetical protein